MLTNRVHWSFIAFFIALTIVGGLRYCWSAATGRNMPRLRTDVVMSRITSGAMSIYLFLWASFLILDWFTIVPMAAALWPLISVTILFSVFALIDLWRARGPRIW